MSFRFAALALSAAVLSACATGNNYDSAVNPFDEPPPPSSKGESEAEIRAAVPPRYDSLNAAHVARAAAPAAGAIAFAAPAPPKKQITVEYEQKSVETHTDEMVVEANRLGSLGDSEGKASLLSQAGYAGNPSAFYDLSRMYLDGSLPIDMQQAINYLTLSHNGGHPEATRVLGLLYLRGQGVPQDEHYGRLLLEQSAKQSVRAAREYGQLLVNERSPALNDPALGIQYLRDAANRGDTEAALSLSKALSRTGNAEEAEEEVPSANNSIGTPGISSDQSSSLKDRALRGDANAVFTYAQQVLVRKVQDPEPEFTAYCWFSVAQLMGHPNAARELSPIEGVRLISEKEHPGRLDQCIRDLHYQIDSPK